MIKTSSLDQVRHWDGLVVHMHGYSHTGIVLYGGAMTWVYTIVSGVSHVVE